MAVRRKKQGKTKIEGDYEKRSRIMTFTVLASEVDEKDLKAFFDKYRTSLVGGAYIKHDKDVYTELHAELIRDRLNQKLERIEDLKSRVDKVFRSLRGKVSVQDDAYDEIVRVCSSTKGSFGSGVAKTIMNKVRRLTDPKKIKSGDEPMSEEVAKLWTLIAEVFAEISYQTYNHRDGKKKYVYKKQLKKYRSDERPETLREVLRRLISAEVDGINDKINKAEAGKNRPTHWHVLLNWGANSQTHDRVATFLKISPDSILSIKEGAGAVGEDAQGKKGFIKMMGYFTHITRKAREEGKHKYSCDEVKEFKFPDDEYKTYAEFAEDFGGLEASGSDYLRMVATGSMTVKEVLKYDLDFALSNEKKLERARRSYLDSLPMPSTRLNYFIGSKYGSGENGMQSGRVGKGLATQLLAYSHLKMRFPGVDFSKVNLNESNEYVFNVGGEGVSFQEYDGQPIIIWDDARSDKVAKAFGGMNVALQILDIYPKAIALNKKYGSVTLKNSIFIFNGVETYNEFVKGLSSRVGYTDDGRGLIHEDESQIRGRFPFFIEVSPDFITAEARLHYLLGTQQHDFRKSYPNNLKLLAEANALHKETEWLGKDYLEVSSLIEGRSESDEIKLDILDGVSFDSVDLRDVYNEQVTKVKDEIVGLLGRIRHEVAERKRLGVVSGFVRLGDDVPERFGDGLYVDVPDVDDVLTVMSYQEWDDCGTPQGDSFRNTVGIAKGRLGFSVGGFLGRSLISIDELIAEIDNLVDGRNSTEFDVRSREALMKAKRDSDEAEIKRIEKRRIEEEEKAKAKEREARSKIEDEAVWKSLGENETQKPFW